MSSPPTESAPRPEESEPLHLDKSLLSWRSMFSSVMTVSCVVASLLAMLPLFSVIYMLIKEGLRRFDPSVFTERPPPFEAGFGPAIMGTLVVVGVAAAIAVPVGILIGLFLSEFGEKSRFPGVIRFCAKLLTGIPSILAGVFAYSVVVLTRDPPKFSALAGGVALSILMLPVVILTAEEAFQQVPRKMREAAYGMGCTDTQVALKVVAPTALPGVLTGVMLAIARACGETAPLLFTALFTEQWFKGDLMRPISSLAVFIYNFSRRPSPSDVDLAWTASLTLVAVVLLLNVTAQLVSRRLK